MVGVALLCVINSSLVRVYAPIHEVKLTRDVELVAVFKDSFDLIVKSYAEIPPYPYRVIIEDMEQEILSRKEGYHSFDWFVDTFTQIAINHKHIAVLDTIGWSYEGRPILVMKLSDDPQVDEHEPALLFVGLHHAREWPSLEVVLFFADTLTKAYGHDSLITELINSCEVYLLPCLNPDGYVYCHDEGIDWRKNRHYFEEFDTYGVDLNRNYGGATNGDYEGDWGSLVSWAVSHYPRSPIYTGEAPFSELETQALRDLILQEDFVFAVTYHTYGELVIWPWGYTLERAPDSTILEDIGYEMAFRITRQSGYGTYTAQQSSMLYPTSGDMCDWLYGYSLYVRGYPTFPYTVETCSEFHPPAECIHQIVRENFDAAVYLMAVADSIRGLRVPWIVSPVITNADYRDTILTVEWHPPVPGYRYALEKSIGWSWYIDSAESETNWWVSNGFVRSDDRSYSGSYSYFSNLDEYAAEHTHWMVTPIAFPVDTADTVTFAIWYDIEYLWDRGFFEVSTNGREWYVIDNFTGSSDGWEVKSYPLQDYAGKSIYLRFRYEVDMNEFGEGMYVDDIKIQRPDTVITIDTCIIDTFYSFVVTPGTYYLRVRGAGTRGWGDWSAWYRVTTETGIVSYSAKGWHVRPAIATNALEIQHEGNVKLNMFDIMGRRVYEMQLNGHGVTKISV
ncbi:MAG: hypothetical protein DRN92_09170, partial [Thermoproteota archaeon]